MSDTPCTCQANHSPVVAAPPVVLAPLTTQLDQATLDEVVEAFTAAAADAADTRYQALEDRVTELETALATVLADWSQSQMAALPA